MRRDRNEWVNSRQLRWHQTLALGDHAEGQRFPHMSASSALCKPPCQTVSRGQSGLFAGAGKELATVLTTGMRQVSFLVGAEFKVCVSGCGVER